MQSLPLDLQFDVERKKRYLDKNPDKAAELAIAYFEDFSMLAIEYKKLEAAHKSLTSTKKPSLPYFLKTNH